MAKIRQKNNKRCRVQITTAKKVWEEYVRNQRLAAELKVEIDLSGDFSVWLSRQNDQVWQELQNLKAMADEDQQGAVETGKTVSSEMVAEEAEVDGGDNSI